MSPFQFGVPGGLAARRSDPYGSTRTFVGARHALLTSDGLVSAPPPGWRCPAFYTMISPAMGARFCQYHADLGADGTGEGHTGGREWVLYVLAGGLTLSTGGKQGAVTGFAAGGSTPETAVLLTGGYAYLPPGTAYRLAATEPGTGLLIFEKRYEPAPGVPPPAVLTGREADVPGAPFLGDPAAMLQTLLPDRPEFDLAVNVFKYAPGATLPFVETHVMEHGLLMLAGEGIYRLEDRWYPVRAGDAIWMAPYCPQWFVATGKTPASYIYYKDVNRWPVC